MKKFAFVILHYFTIEDTKKCVESILDKGKKEEIDIVIVDNASKNDTGIELKEYYKSFKNIHVILNKENLGFARGNNVGFKYAKEKLNPDFIIMCNNDTYLLQNNFFKLIQEEYNKSNFSVLGPKIILPNDEINDLILDLPNSKIVKKQLRDERIDYFTNFFYINKFYNYIRRSIKNLLIKLKIKKKPGKKPSTENRYENIVLHGSFLIFSRNYLDIFDGLDSRTFLYREEELLALRLKNNNLKSVYNPKIMIFHNEDGATNAITKNNRKKQLFICKNLIASTKILLNELESNGGTND